MRMQSKNFRNGKAPPLQKVYDGFAFCFDTCLMIDGVAMPHRIFPKDDTPRTFINCNLVNAIPPVGSRLRDCNTSIIERNLMTDEIDRHGEPVCECIVHGRTNPETLKIEEKSDKQRVSQ